jgi:hypothetical protein
MGITTTGFCYLDGILQLFHRQDQQILWLPTAATARSNLIGSTSSGTVRSHPEKIIRFVGDKLHQHRRIQLDISKKSTKHRVPVQLNQKSKKSWSSKAAMHQSKFNALARKPREGRVLISREDYDLQDQEVYFYMDQSS